jgi:hypothetical protein
MQKEENFFLEIPEKKTIEDHPFCIYGDFIDHKIIILWWNNLRCKR